MIKNFSFIKTPDKGFTTQQLKRIHNSLQNLGYEKDFSSFYSELAELCKKYDEYPLTSKEVSPIISEHIFGLLESYSQTEIRSKVFALASVQRKAQTALYVPTIYFSKRSILNFLQKEAPELCCLLDIMPDLEQLPGFAKPTTEKYETMTYEPKEETVTGILTGTTTAIRLTNDGTQRAERELCKVSLFVTSNDIEYEIPLYLQVRTGSIFSTFEEKNGLLLAEKKVLLTVGEYTEEFSDILLNRPNILANTQTFKNKIQMP